MMKLGTIVLEVKSMLAYGKKVMHKGRDLWIGGPPFSVYAIENASKSILHSITKSFHSSSFPLEGSPKKAGGTFLFEMDNGFQKAVKIHGIPAK